MPVYPGAQRTQLTDGLPKSACSPDAIRQNPALSRLFSCKTNPAESDTVSKRGAVHNRPPSRLTPQRGLGKNIAKRTQEVHENKETAKKRARWPTEPDRTRQEPTLSHANAIGNRAMRNFAKRTQEAHSSPDSRSLFRNPRCTNSSTRTHCRLTE